MEQLIQTQFWEADRQDVTVTFVGGDKVTFPADVRAAGDER